MIIRVDFDSSEAIYLQLCKQIIIGIANAEIKDGDNLPSVRELAEEVGINMHTVNKAYRLLRQEGYLKVDRRHGAIIAVEVDQVKAQLQLAEELKLSLAKAISKGIPREVALEMVEQIYEIYLNGNSVS
ncbi:MAG: GntR family transcriptional regulator [Lachnospiraceae bacterium]|nr:GntR family transcriptional regulator [Lachnospiraceae bacterium]